ncbi:hypothetical protein HMPREF9374_2281 [Desmospora sp. 8437]|nr:hypothetical protein HMPREF9374_2281 [Desmospora sp. 8437]
MDGKAFETLWGRIRKWPVGKMKRGGFPKSFGFPRVPQLGSD